MTTIFLRHKETQVSVSAGKEIIIKIIKFLEPYLEVNFTEERCKLDWAVFIVNLDSAEGYDVIMPSNSNMILYISKLNKEIIITNEKNNLYYLDIIRVIRSLFRWVLWSQNELFIHGGFLSVNSKGLAICGHRKSGKTSLIMSMLAQKNVCYGTNDDMSVFINKNEIKAYGWTKSIGVRQDTYQAIKNIAPKFLEANNVSHPNNLKDYKMNPEDRIFYMYNQFTDIYENPVVNGVNLNMIVFLTFKGFQGEKSKIKVLTPNEAEIYLLDNIEPYPDTNILLDEYVDSPSHELLKQEVKKITLKVPCFLLEQYFNTLGSSVDLLLSLTNSINIKD